jgi:diaminohydroxyphosphoribosylaminopyrimidine deaminase/5-amino-6-(5-phosphoribosylamino)uracil reductase
MAELRVCHPLNHADGSVARNGSDPKPTLPVTRLLRGAASGKQHGVWMDEALILARSSQGLVWPNPAVGCVIVRHGVVVGRGRTQIGGAPHAERVALNDAGTQANGATLYVTLEPCCHWGRTPPCADAIIAAGVTAVYAALQDPDPRVNGHGFSRLRDAGVVVHVGLGAREARRIMRGFFKRVATGRPFISVISAAEAHIGRVPSTYDGSLVTGEDGHRRLLVREAGTLRQKKLIKTADVQTLLDHCGELGLTSLFVMNADPLARDLREAGLVDSFTG